MKNNSDASSTREKVFQCLSDREMEIIRSGNTLTTIRINEIAEACDLSPGTIRIAIIEHHMECIFELIEATELSDASKAILANHRRSIANLTGN